MKLIFIKIALISTTFFIVNTAHAYKFIIYTDEVTNKSALKVSEELKTTYPFSKFIIEVEIVTVPSKELKCSSELGIKRLITCSNSNKIQKRAIKSGGDQALIILESTTLAGSSTLGGGVPVITTSMPNTTIIHEYLHTLGIGDEYEYVAPEAIEFCKKLTKVPNYVFIDPLDPYASDSMAKAKHMRQIPWANDILSSTPITNTNGTRLGTKVTDTIYIYSINKTNKPTQISELTGLYRGKVCMNDSPPKVTWQPGPDVTVMGNDRAGLGPSLEKIVERIMISKGAKLKPFPVATNDVIDGETNIKINNSSMIKTIDSDDGQLFKSSQPKSTFSK